MAIFWSEYPERARNPYSFSCLSAGLYISQAGGTKIFKYHADPGNAGQYLKSSVSSLVRFSALRRLAPTSPGWTATATAPGHRAPDPGFRLTGVWPLQSTVVYRNAEFFSSSGGLVQVGKGEWEMTPGHLSLRGGNELSFDFDFNYVHRP